MTGLTDLKSRNRIHFYAKIDEEIESTIQGMSDIRLLKEVTFDGASVRWRVDRVLAAKPLLSKDYAVDLAIIEIKHIGPASGKGRYHQHMSYAYMELNDIRLGCESKTEIGTRVPKFYLIVNRFPMVGEPKRDYQRIFETIRATMVNFNDDTRRATFLEEIRGLSQEWGSYEQYRKLAASFDKATLRH